MKALEYLKTQAGIARMNALYGKDVSARYEALAQKFEEKFSSEPLKFVSAPGRTEVVGNHTDHNHGAVLAAAVNLDTVAAVKPTGDLIVTLFSEGYDRPFKVDLSDLTVYEKEKESTYALIRGIAARMKELGYEIGGFNAMVTSTVFKGSGLSSSAAFEVLLVAIFDSLFNGWKVDPKLNAKISQYAENVFFGKPCGLMDQMASAVGGLVTIDFGGADAEVEAISYDFKKKGYNLVVVTAGGEHGNLTADYAAIPYEMKAVAKQFGKEVLRQIDPDELEKAIPTLKNKVSDRSILRALHFMDENKRVKKMVQDLKNDDLDAFFEGIILSGESSWKLLQNLSVPTSDNQEMMLALAMSERMLRGNGAWRIHGGGFAGTILAFVPDSLLNTYRTRMNAVFGDNACTVLSVRPEGAVEMG